MRRAATGAVRTAIERTSPPADTARNGRETGSRSRSAGTFTRSRAKPSGWGEVGPPEEATAIEKAAAEFKVPAPIWGRRLRVEEDQWHYRSGPSSANVALGPSPTVEAAPTA
jgi:hypothetical protein